MLLRAPVLGRPRLFIRVALLALSLVTEGLCAAEPPVIPLWPEGVPGLLPTATAETVEGTSVTNVHRPTLTLYAAAHPNGTALIVCPGGAYTHLSIANEGSLVAARFNAMGVSVFVLRYRLKEYGHPAPLRDVLRAVRLVRARSTEWGVAAHRIGVWGASAGGHLAASAATLYDDPAGRTGAALDTVSARPDFVILLYPVITLQDEPYVHKGSRRALLGDHPTPELLAHLSPDLQVTAQTPPTFLVHGGDDKSVPVENSLRFYRALHRAGVPAELTVFPVGIHGFGMRQDVGEASTWPGRCEQWLRAGGWLPAPLSP